MGGGGGVRQFSSRCALMSMPVRERIASWKRRPTRADPQSVCAFVRTTSARTRRVSSQAPRAYLQSMTNMMLVQRTKPTRPTAQWK